ncbi:MAG: kynureninase [Betaproteobacteria bacterium]
MESSSTTAALDRDTLVRMDAADPLAAKREAFALPEGVIYLDGNSLGALPRRVVARMRRAVEQEWGEGLIRSWNDAGWYPAPRRAGAAIARLVGAKPEEVIVCDSTSVNLYKALIAALRLRPGRKLIVSEKGNFPTDVYVNEGVAELMGVELRCVEHGEVESAIRAAGGDLALVQLTHVNYRSGLVYDMARITALAHEQGALAIWDLSHSTGTLPVDLNACGVDFAVGCGYKYLNGGPGSPAFIFVAERHLPNVRQPLQGWHGHARPFAFDHDYAPHAGIDRMLVGTAPQLSLIALEEALTVFEDVDMHALRAKGSALSDCFIRLVDQELADHGFGLASPRDAVLRGSQVSLTHPEGYAIMQALIARGVIGDFRAPDVLRFGFAGLYVRYVDVWNAVAALKDIMATRAWDRPAFRERKAVT